MRFGQGRAIAPGVSHDCGGDTKGHDIGDRIELDADFRSRLGHARNASVERVADDGETDGPRRAVEIFHR